MRKPTEPFATFIDSFMVAKTLAPTTREDYTRYLRDFDKFTGHTSLKNALTLDNGAKWVDSLRVRGPFSTRNGCMALKSFATWIKKTRQLVIPGGGSILAGLEVPSVPKSTRHAFTDAEMEIIYKALEFRPNRDKIRGLAVVTFMAETGLRRNEARQVSREDLLIRTDGRGGAVRVRATTSKGQKERIVRLSSRAIAALETYLNDDRRPTYTGPAPEPLFLKVEGGNAGGKKNGKPYGQAFTKNGWGTWLDRIWDDIEKETRPEGGKPGTGIKGSSHFLRHTAATNYARGMQYTGNNIYDFRNEFGWADTKISERYTHDRPEEEFLAMETPADALRRRRRVAS